MLGVLVGEILWDRPCEASRAGTTERRPRMPYINCRVMEAVLSRDQKAELAAGITETFASVYGEPVRGLTWW
jgi:hypothetical protein